MTNAAKRKGDAAEREAAKLLSDLLGVPAERKLGAGRKEDTGDIYGVPDTVIQVANYRDITLALRRKLDDCPIQQERAGATFGAAMIRRPGGRWFVAMTPEQFATLWREATDPTSADKERNQ